MLSYPRSASLLLAFFLFALSAKLSADRLYGNAAFNYQHVKETNHGIKKDNLTNGTLIIGYEDALFTKNWIRLAANLTRRKFSFTDYHEFRSIYYFDLSSYGYALNTSYSPYKRLDAYETGQGGFYIYSRDWRSSLQLNYPKWPTFGVIYNRNYTFDREAVRRNDGISRNFVADANYGIGPMTFRIGYNNLKQASYVQQGYNNLLKTYNATTGFNKSLPRYGFLSTTYNYYYTRRFNNGVINQKSLTHSISAMVGSVAWMNLNANLSYSGRFFGSSQKNNEFHNNSQNISAQADYSPTGYLSFQGIKGYQIDDELGRNQIVEYLAYSTNINRYIREGVDTRLTYNRTIYQQSNRSISILDSSGAVAESINKGKYHLDTYYASLSFEPYNYVKTYVDLSLTRDSDPVDVLARYQLTRSIDTRAVLSGALEGRFSYGNLYRGDKLRWGRSYSENYNLGLTYIPESNLNLNLTYIYSRYNVGAKSSNGSVTGYISYSFRRAFSVYFTVNQQTQKRQELTIQQASAQEEINKPYALNGQLLIYLTPRTTFSNSYFYNKTKNAAGQTTASESLQTMINIQI